jgi:hypothetical protein
MIKFDYPKLTYNYPFIEKQQSYDQPVWYNGQDEPKEYSKESRYVVDRINGERQFLFNFLNYAATQGWKPYKVHNGEEPIRTPNVEAVLEHVNSVDDSHLYMIKHDQICSIYIVCGNEPEELFNDWAEPRDDKYGFGKLMRDFCLED